MIIDCDSCQARPAACGDCVIGVLMGAPAPAGELSDAPPGAPVVQLDAPERRALAVLAEQGLIPRLRLVAPEPRRTSGTDDPTGSMRDAG